MAGRKPISKHCKKQNSAKFTQENRKRDTYSCTSPLETNKCESCPFQTNFLLHLNNHLIIHTSGSKPKCKFLSYVCQKCQFTTHSILTLYKHVSDLCDSLQWFKCDQCTFKTHQNQYLIRHKKNKHTSDEETRWFQCKLCSHRTRWKGNLKDHIAAKHLQTELQLHNCDICEFQTSWKNVLKRHKLKKHYYDTTPKWLKCEDCDFKTLRNDSLRRHVTSLHLANNQARWFKCDICRIQTRRSDQLKRHKQLVHGPRSVTRPVQVLGRVKIEIPEPPKLCLNDFGMKCEMAPKRELQDVAPQISPLPHGSYVKIQPRNEVVELPPQERWFSCDQCPFSAKLETSLKIHKLGHKKGSDRVVYFKCGLCPLQTDRKDNLQRHIRETHVKWTPKDQCLVKAGVFNVQRFCCDLCSFSTEWMNSLSVHKVLTHQENRAFGSFVNT